MERRRQNRVQLRAACEVRANGLTLSATLLDLSEGGLSVRLLEEELEHGTPTLVTLALPRGERLTIESLVWHSRRLKPRRDEKAALVVGLVVANPSEAYLKLVAERDKVRAARSRPAARPRPPSAAAQAPLPPAPSAAAAAASASDAPPPAEPAPPAVGLVWRVRLQLSGSPRSRTILVETENAENAAARAMEEAGEGWIVLEVVEA
jgi:hypothetical protein